MSSGIVLRALDGSNPLAFLAALGTLRLLHRSAPEMRVQMCWERLNGPWRPIIRGMKVDENELCELLMRASWAPVESFESIGKNITVPKEKFTPFVAEAYSTANLRDRRRADFAAAFGCEVCEDEKKDEIEYTKLCFITGSGHQNFLGTIAALAMKVSSEHLRDTLFGKWREDEGLSMRWNPSDAAEYALRWRNPGQEGASAVWGANRLAAEALPYFPTLAGIRGLKTTGFERRDRQDEFSWPIWSRFVSFDTVRSLVSFGKLQELKPKSDMLLAMGIEQVYRAQRDRIGQGANFKVSFRPARAV